MSAAASVVAGVVERGGFRLDVDLRFDERVVVLFGPTGSGKSTLFELILGLSRPARARVCIAGEWLEDSERGLCLPVEARRLGWVPQRPTLFPHLSVERNLRFGLRRGGAAGARALELAVEVLELGELLGRAAAALSGGEQQRVAIGRALASGPRALLLDEPLASLDLALRARVLRHLLRLRDELAIPIFYITHDPDEALLVAERVAVLDAGREVASGPPREVLWSRAVRPLSQTLGLENVLSGRVIAAGGGEATLETDGGLRLVLPVALAPGERVDVGIRAEDVLLAADPPGRVSARNVFPARVVACDVEDGHATVSLEAAGGHDRLVALVTAGAAAALGLREGGSVHALVKSQAIRRIA